MKGSSGGDGAGMDKAHYKIDKTERPRSDLTQNQVQQPGKPIETRASQQGDGRNSSRRDLTEPEQGPDRSESADAKRQRETLETLENNGFFKRSEIKAILQRGAENPQSFENLKEAISVELAIQASHLNPQQFEFHRSVVISEKIEGVSTLQDWRKKNGGENLYHAYMYNGAVWKTIGEADVLVLQKQGASPIGTIHTIMEVKTGHRDKAAKAQEQLDNVRAALKRFEQEPTRLGIHSFQRDQPMQDLTDHIKRSDASQFEGQVWGAREKDGFPKRFPLGSKDFRSITETALKKYGGQIE